MHILLTDILTCPRCGPAFGLILLADRSENRRILEGALGCANCREKYPVRNAVVRFTAGPAPVCDDGDEHEALRLAAFMGVTGGTGYVLLCGPAARHAVAVARLLEGVQVIAAAYGGGEGGADPADADVAAYTQVVNALVVARALPFATGRLAGVVLSGTSSSELLEEAARATSPLGRLVVLDAPRDATERIAAAGLRTIVAEGGAVVAARR